MKRYFAVVSMMCLFALAGIAGAVAQEVQKANPATDFEYDLTEDGEGLYIYDYTGTATEVVIPAEIEDFPVVAIRFETFKGTNVISVVFPNSIRRIGDSCFEECSYLQKVVLPNSDIEISSSCFAGCTSLQNVVLPKNLKTIAENLFKDCTALKTITLPDSIETIYKDAFQNSGLESITIPDSVKQIANGDYDSYHRYGSGVFSHCKNLKTVTIGNGIEFIGAAAFFGCTNLTTVTIGSGIRSIRDGAFEDCSSLTTVNIGAEKLVGGSYISVLENDAFERRSYERTYETGYGDYVFSGCSALSLKEKQKIRKTGYTGAL